MDSYPTFRGVSHLPIIDPVVDVSFQRRGLFCAKNPSEVAGGQVFAPHSLSVCALNHPAHLFAGIKRAVIVAASKLIDVTVKVLTAHLVIRSDVTALEASPERLYAVRMGLAVDVLLDRVLDRLVVRQGRGSRGVRPCRPLRDFRCRTGRNLGALACGCEQLGVAVTCSSLYPSCQLPETCELAHAPRVASCPRAYCAQGHRSSSHRPRQGQRREARTFRETT